MEFLPWFAGQPVFIQSEYHPHTLNEFRAVLQGKIPADFNRKGVTALPFPARIVAGINRKDIDAIMTGLGWINRIGFAESTVGAAYHTLSEHFRTLNEEFLRASEPIETRPDVESILTGIEFLSSKGVASAPLFFITSFAWAHQNVRALVTKRKRNTRNELRTAQNWAKNMQLALHELLDAQQQEEWWHLRENLKSLVNKQIKQKSALQRSIQEIDDIIAQNLDEIQNRHREMQTDFSKQWGHQNGNPVLVHIAYRQVVELISQGWKKHGSKSEATRFLGLWGIEHMTPEASKKRQQRVR